MTDYFNRGRIDGLQGNKRQSFGFFESLFGPNDEEYYNEGYNLGEAERQAKMDAARSTAEQIEHVHKPPKASWECPDCKKPISRIAQHCPHCGLGTLKVNSEDNSNPFNNWTLHDWWLKIEEPKINAKEARERELRETRTRERERKKACELRESSRRDTGESRYAAGHNSTPWFFIFTLIIIVTLVTLSATKCMA